MIYRLSQQPTSHLFVQLEEGVRSKSSLLSRFQFTLNWEKVMHVSNIAFIIAGIAYGFFMHFPLMSLGLTGYGILYLTILLKVKGGDSSSGKFYELQSQLQDAEDKGRGLNGKMQANLRESGHQEQAGRDQKKIARIAENRARLESERKRLKVDRDQLKDEIRVLERREAFSEVAF